MIVKIKNKGRVEQFNQFAVTLKYDSVASVFSFAVYFDPNNEDHKELWKPGSFFECDVEFNDELLIRGFIVDMTHSDEPQKKLSVVSGYSLTGLLEDCQIPTSTYPIQTDGGSLKNIAEKLLRPFGLKVLVDKSVSKRATSFFEISTSSVTQTVKQYLSAIASQKDIVMTHTPEGDLLFTQPSTKQQPIIDITNGLPNTTMRLDFKGQRMHSQITVMMDADIDGANAGESTVKNPFISIFKPSVRTQSSADDIDTPDTARNALAAELKNITLTITTDRWLVNDKIIRPGDIITVLNPNIHLYKRSRWFIDEVTLEGNEKSTIATLKCVLPEVYNGEIPKNIFD
jgi:prophage tail gpP-like protein